MTNVAAIAKSAFDGVSAAITDAVLSGTLSDGTSSYSGRVVFTSAKPATGFPLSDMKGRVGEATLEGFSAVPAAGWTVTAGGDLFYVLGVRDILQTGALANIRLIKSTDLLWKAVTFERATRTDDGAGGYTRAWATLATAQGGLVAMSGQDRFASQRIEETSRWQLVAAAVSGLTSADRAVIDGVNYAINFVDDHEGRGAFMVLDLGKGQAT